MPFIAGTRYEQKGGKLENVCEGRQTVQVQFGEGKESN